MSGARVAGVTWGSAHGWGRSASTSRDAGDDRKKRSESFFHLVSSIGG
jgi:hypothetical protein